MTAAERIRAVRKEKGLTQTELGELLDVTQATVQQYESEKRVPKLETLKRIAEAMKVNVNCLLSDEGYYWQKNYDIAYKTAYEQLYLLNLSELHDEEARSKAEDGARAEAEHQANRAISDYHFERNMPHDQPVKLFSPPAIMTQLTDMFLSLSPDHQKEVLSYIGYLKWKEIHDEGGES